MDCWKKFCGSNKFPVKVTDEKRSRKVGFIVSDLADLKKKANNLFQMTNPSSPESLSVFLDDGTEISDDGFLKCQGNQLLIVTSKKTLSINGTLEKAMEQYLNAVWEIQQFSSNEITQFFEHNKDEKLRLTWQYVSTLSTTKGHLSSIKDHPEWFTGCNKLVTTKEEYFRKCAQSRIRSYLRDAKNRISQNKLPDGTIVKLKNLLENQKYFACYFDRANQSLDRLCDSKGQFQCQGHYNKPACEDGHWINPYNNAESRVLFSTWNLDHIIERVKIISELCSEIRCNNECDHLKYFDLLFTRKNLKFVHKNCHVIGQHIECQMVQT